jgi:hypothetical protein
MGLYTTASGFSSTAMGEFTTASGGDSTAMGYDTTASGDYSTAMGTSTTAPSYAETVIGLYNTAYNLETDGDLQPNPTDRLFVIGNGQDIDNPSDAMVVLKNGNTGIGISTPEVPLHVDDGSDCEVGSGGYIITDATSTTNICIDDNEILARNSGVGSTLYIQKSDSGGLTWFGGKVRIDAWATATADYLCRDDTTLALCTSSARYKEDIQELPLGLSVVEQLDPVKFKWKGRDEVDLGFIAEDVAAIDPLLATYNDDGEIQGVKYPQLTAVLVNAVQEQQKAMEAQQQAMKEQQAEIASLREEVKQYETLARKFEALDQRLARLLADETVALKH